jgi:hypothetical protein
MKPGLLPGVLPVRPLRRLSPSRFTALQGCALREVWASGRQPPLLPVSPRARLGTAAHELLELAAKGHFGISPSGLAELVEEAWEMEVAKAEQEMAASWLERHLVPLRESVADYEVLRLRACHKAREIASESLLGQRTRDARPMTGFEVWVATNDGSVGGFIDAVQETNEGPVLRDYKSGYVLERIETGGVAQIKKSYELQLKIYAALYEAAYGRWPVGLEIVPLQGEAIAVPFQPREAVDLLSAAKDCLKGVNDRIGGISTTTDPASLAEGLATPKPSICGLCTYRPACTAYRRARQSSDEPGWPEDVWGVVTEIRQLGNGRLSIAIETINRLNETRVRGLDPSTSRHPALAGLQVADSCGVFNLRGSSASSGLVETSRTVFYRASPACSMSEA